MQRRDFLSTTAGGAAAFTLGCSSRNLAGGGRPPNFVVLFADDQGYQDLGCFGSPDIKTPRIDRMAAEGMKFTDFHVAASVCTPSRAALLTGCYPQRVDLPLVLFPQDNVGLDPGEITMAELLRAQGYATACIGKWHLGHLPPHLPTRHGFDHYFGLPYSNDMHPPNKARNYPPLPLMQGEEVIETDPDQGLLTERYTEEAVRFIEQNAGRPFFLYLPHTMAHTPLAASDRFRGKSARGPYGDAIETIDWSTGEILDALARLGLDENTLVIYTSDNGPAGIRRPNGGRALPLRAGKATAFEGGHREPCVVRWPGRIPAGSTCDAFCSTMDLLPTFALLSGSRAPRDRKIDGHDIRPLFFGQSGDSPYEYFYHYLGGRLRAVRSGDWKYFPPYDYQRNNRRYNREAMLFNLREDISETNNVKDANPEVVARMEAAAERMRGELGDLDTNRKGRAVRPCAEAPQA